MKNWIFVVAILVIGLLSGSCGKKKTENEQPVKDTVLTLEQVELFARTLEQSVNNDNPHPGVIANAFDASAFRLTIQKNPEAASALDLNFGQAILEGNLNYGERVVGIVNGGGDFRFDTCYHAGGEFHAIFRLYDTLGNVQFDDFTIAMGKEFEPRIVEGWSYNGGCRISTKISSEVLYNAMQTMGKLDPYARKMQEVVELGKAGKHKEILTILQKNQQIAQYYPAYFTYYLAAIGSCSSNYIADLEKLEETGINERFILTHKLNYYTQTSDFEAITEVINRLIEITGDDPVYCLQASKTLINAHHYEDALEMLNVAKAAMPYIWDIWRSELVCYKQLNDADTYQSCLEAGKKLYGLSDEELKSL